MAKLFGKILIIGYLTMMLPDKTTVKENSVFSIALKHTDNNLTLLLFHSAAAYRLESRLVHGNKVTQQLEKGSAKRKCHLGRKNAPSW